MTLLLLLERARGATLAWHLLTLLAAAGLGSWSVVRARQDRQEAAVAVSASLRCS